MRKIAVAVVAALLLWPQLALALTASSTPTKVPTSWGSSAPGGDITCPMPIPSQIPITAGRASWTDGFPPLNFLPAASGGIPPFGQDMNGVLCQLSQWTRWSNAGGPIFYDSSFSGIVGGYPKWAMLSNATTVGCFWISQVDNNTSNPDSGGANWLNTCANGVAAGTYIAPTITVDASGRLTAAASGSSTNSAVNVGIAASVAGNALTINLTTASGATPSPASPVIVPVRSATANSGVMQQAIVTGALSITVPAGATLGTSNFTAFRLWIFLVYNGSTPQLAVALCSLSTGTTFPCAGWEAVGAPLQAISSGSTSAGVPYAASFVGSTPARIVGYCEYDTGLSVAGTWNSSCGQIQVFEGGVKKPGEVVQRVFNSTTSSVACSGPSGNVQTPLSAAIAPTSNANLILARGDYNYNFGNALASGSNAEQLSRGSAPTYFGTQALLGLTMPSTGGSIALQGSLQGIDFPSTTSSTTYFVYCDTTTGAGGVWNKNNALLTIILEEIMG